MKAEVDNGNINHFVWALVDALNSYSELIHLPYAVECFSPAYKNLKTKSGVFL
jgi:hypothetical protein